MEPCGLDREPGGTWQLFLLSCNGTTLELTFYRQRSFDKFVYATPQLQCEALHDEVILTLESPQNRGYFQGNFTMVSRLQNWVL